MFDQYVYEDVVYQYIEHFCSTVPKAKLFKMSGKISLQKMAVCLKMLDTPQDTCYIYVAKIKDINPLFWETVRIEGLFKEHDILLMSEASLQTLSTRENTFKALVDALKYMTKTCDTSNAECQICLGSKNLAKCIMCSAHYCRGCISPLLKKCHTCGVEFTIKQTKSYVTIKPKTIIPSLMFGCVMSLLEAKHDIDTKPLMRNVDLLAVIMFFLSDEAKYRAIHRYMNFEAFIECTKFAFME